MNDYLDIEGYKRPFDIFIERIRDTDSGFLFSPSFMDLEDETVNDFSAEINRHINAAKYIVKKKFKEEMRW